MPASRSGIDVLPPLDQLMRVPGVEHQLDQADAERELSSGLYEPSTGLWPGTHWRAYSPTGKGGLHLRRNLGRWYLHYDKADPRKDLAAHLCEPAVAVPLLLAGAALALAWRSYAR